nr:hypothetical protein [Tanacetum cinerariifolium]
MPRQGNLLSKTTREALKIIKNKSKVRYSRSKSNVSRVSTNSRDSASKTDDRIDKLADQISNLVEIVNKQVITPATAKAVKKTSVTCGGAHAYYDCIATDSNQPSVCAATCTYNQVSSPNRASRQIPPPGFAPVQNNPNRNNQSQGQGNNFNRGNNFQNNQGYRASSNNAPNFQNQPFQVPNNQVQPGIPNELLNYMKSSETLIRNMQNQINVLSFADALLLMPKFASTIKSLFTNKDKLFELAKVPLNENCSAMLLKKLPKKIRDPKLTPTRMTLELADRSITRPKGVAEDVFVKVGKFHFPTNFVVVDFEADPRYNSKSINPTLVSNPSFSEETKSDFCKEPIVKSSSPTLTLFGESDFFLEEIEGFLNDESIPTGIENSFYDPEGDILYLEKLLNDDPFQLPLMDLKQAEETKAKSSIEEPPELELKELLSHIEYAFLEDTDKLAEDYKPAIQSQRRVNPKIHEVIKMEVIKLLNAEMIYPISNSPWVSPIHCVPKKGGMTVVANENNKLIPTSDAPQKASRKDLGKFLIPCDFPGMDVCQALADLGASINIMPLSSWKKLSLPKLTPTRMTLELEDQSITRPKGVSEDVFVKVEKEILLGTGRALIRIYGEEITLRVNDKAVTFKFNQTTRYSSTYDDLSVNRIDIIDVAREEYAQEILGFSNNSSGGNPTLNFEHILSDSSLSVTSFEGSDFILEKIDAYLKDESILQEIDHADCDPKGDICLIEKLLNDNLFQLPPMDLKQGEKITDIKGIDARFYTYKILMEEDYKPAVQSQRRVNPKIHEVIKKEVIKLLDAGMIYPISDSPWVSPIHCVPKKGGITIVENENNELIPKWKRPLSPIPMEHLLIAECPLAFAMLLGHFKAMRFSDPFFITNGDIKFLQEKNPPEQPRLCILFVKKDCIDAFKTLKKKLTEAPILVVPNWNLPFKLMCDASEFAIGVVLGQRNTKHFQPIHYASKTMTKAQIRYITTKKEMLAVVYAFKMFRPYLVLSKSIVYKGHLALKYLHKKTKKIHDSKSKNRILNVGDRVLLFNSRHKIFSRKLKTRWSGPFTITKVFPYGTVELSQPDGPNFKVNGHRMKHYFGGDVPQLVVPDLQAFPMDK